MDPLTPHDAQAPLDPGDVPSPLNPRDVSDSPPPPLTRRPLLALTLIAAGLGLWLNYSIQASEPSASTVTAQARATAIALASAPFTDFFPVPTDIASDAYAPAGSLPTAPAYILSYPPGTPVAGGAAGMLAPDDGDAGCSGIHCIQHVVIIMMENQSFDRLFGSFQSAMGTPVDGYPVDGSGHPLPCLPDPRQSEQPAGVVLSCEHPYHVPYTPSTGVGPAATQTAVAYRVQQNLNDNPHAAQDSYTDTIGVPPTVGLTPGLTPTPMTGFLAAAWAWCNQPITLTGGYETYNAACNTPIPPTPGPGTPTDTPTPLGAPTATLVPFDVMRYLNGDDVPFYWYYAGYYLLQDHLFEPVASYSLPAHLYMVSNWSAACPLTDPITMQPISGTPTACQNQPATPPAIIDEPGITATPQAYPNYAWTDITYLLNTHQVDAAGATVANGTPAPVGWNYYKADNTTPDCQGYPINCVPTAQPYAGTIEYWNPLQFFTTVHFDGTQGPGTPTPPPNGQGQLGNILNHQNFLDAAHDGTLPAVSWVVPAIDDSDHPPFSLDYGQEYVYELLYALSHGNQAQWQHTAVFLMWDDWGGSYDHELPPSVDGNGYGIRVPGIVISQYAKHCAVDSQPMSFDALDRFIEDDFLGGSRLDPTTDGRPDPRGTAQPVPRETAIAGDLSNDFNFGRTTFPTPGPFGTAPSPAWCSN